MDWNSNALKAKTMMLLAGGVATVAVFSNSAFAFSYKSYEPLMFVYKKGNSWYGCGPTQCTLAPSKTKEEVLDLVTNDWHGRHSLAGNGSYGNCTVYNGDGEVRSYDSYDTKRIVKLIEKTC